MIDHVARAQGCLLSQLAGDALGSLVEFQSPKRIQQSYPNGVRDLEDGGTWRTIAGQPTDDSEMALLLARMLVVRKTYDADAARKAYRYWIDSGPFDCGITIAAGLRGDPNPDSQDLEPYGARQPKGQIGHLLKRDQGLGKNVR